MIQIDKNKLLKALVIILELLAFALIIYLLILPVWPAMQYKLSQPNPEDKIDWQNINAVKKQTEQIVGHLPEAGDKLSSNYIIIPKIGVYAPIIESGNSNYALNKGAWRLPESSTPDKLAGNTVITGHRFKYFPPSNLTFFLLDKITAGDIISVVWQKKEYLYRVKETKIVAKNDLSVLNQTDDATLTVFTCHPIYSQEKRLVVIGKLIKTDNFLENILNID